MYHPFNNVVIFLICASSHRAKTPQELPRKKAESERLTRQARKILCEERIRKYESTKSVKDVVGDVLAECVEAVSEMLAGQAKLQDHRDAAKEEFIEAAVALPKRVKKRRRWST